MAKWKLYYSRLLWAGANFLPPSKIILRCALTCADSPSRSAEGTHTRTHTHTWAVIKEKIIRAEAIISKGATLKHKTQKGFVFLFFVFWLSNMLQRYSSVFLQHKLMRLIKCLIEHFKRLISNSIWVPSSNNKTKQKNPNKHTKKERYRHANLFPHLEHHLAGVYPPVFLRWGNCHRSLTLVKQTEVQTLLFVVSALTH